MRADEPGSACFNGVEPDPAQAVGRHPLLRRRLANVKLGGRRFWRVPVMDGEFVCEDTTGVVTDAVGGGNLLVLGRDRRGLLETVEAAVEAIAGVADVSRRSPAASCAPAPRSAPSTRA